MKDELLIIGASGHGKVVTDIAIKMNQWKKIHFLDDNDSIKNCMGIEIIGKSTEAFKYIDNADIFIAIGTNSIRERFHEKLASAGASIPILIHPNAVIGPEVELKEGTVIMAGVVINASTRIGRGCIINTGTIIEHDSVLEDFVHISPGVRICGYVKIGKGAWLELGSIINNHTNISSNCKVSTGAVVLKDITEPGTYTGNPAEKI